MVHFAAAEDMNTFRQPEGQHITYKSGGGESQLDFLIYIKYHL